MAFYFQSCFEACERAAKKDRPRPACANAGSVWAGELDRKPGKLGEAPGRANRAAKERLLFWDSKIHPLRFCEWFEAATLFPARSNIAELFAKFPFSYISG